MTKSVLTCKWVIQKMIKAYNYKGRWLLWRSTLHMYVFVFIHCNKERYLPTLGQVYTYMICCFYHTDTQRPSVIEWLLSQKHENLLNSKCILHIEVSAATTTMWPRCWDAEQPDGAPVPHLWITRCQAFTSARLSASRLIHSRHSGRPSGESGGHTKTDPDWLMASEMSGVTTAPLRLCMNIQLRIMATLPF